MKDQQSTAKFPSCISIFVTVYNEEMHWCNIEKHSMLNSCNYSMFTAFLKSHIILLTLLKQTVVYSLLVWLAAAASSPDRHRLAVLVEASSAAVDVRVSGRCHWLLPGPDGFG